MSLLFLAALSAWCFERVLMAISAPNYSSVYNGFGVIDLVNRRIAKAPMAYRVLVPWTIGFLEGLFPRVARLAWYQLLKILLETLAFWAVGRAFGLPVMLLTVVLLLLTVHFDYWDWAAELAGVALAATGNPYLACLGIAVHGFSRETALILPGVYFLATGDFGGAVALLAVTVLLYGLVRAVVGRRPLYCERFQLGYNLGLFRAFLDRAFWRSGQFYHVPIWIACAISVGVLAASVLNPSPLAFVPLVFLVAGWTLAKADEPRVFSACLPWVAAWLLGVWH